MEHVRVCVCCEHFAFSPATPDYSELTPGCSAQLSCTRGHWHVFMSELDSGRNLRELLLNALTCKDWQHV